MPLAEEDLEYEVERFGFDEPDILPPVPGGGAGEITPGSSQPSPQHQQQRISDLDYVFDDEDNGYVQVLLDGQVVYLA